MGGNYRQPVGKSVIEGTLTVRVSEEDFFGDDPGTAGRAVEMRFADEGRIPARLCRSSGREKRLKLIFSGKEGKPLRSWLRGRCPSRKARRPRGVLVIERRGKDSFVASIESLSEAAVHLLEIGAQRFFAGARPICVLHPALIDIKDRLATVSLPRKGSVQGIGRAIEKSLLSAGWQEAPSVGGGLLLSGGLRRSGAELHVALEAQDLYLPLLSLGASFESRAIDLGVILVADGSLSRLLKRNGATSPAALDRAVDNIRTLHFMVRGPLGVFALTTRKMIR
ncbi:MAG TPA: hypothetical protein VM425_04040 [Myxococcota bacterium]|nr:hypothetical protein [Myxococcota bacterium]